MSPRASDDQIMSEGTAEPLIAGGRMAFAKRGSHEKIEGTFTAQDWLGGAA